MKNKIFAMVGLVLALGLVLTGCPTEGSEEQLKGVTNSAVKAPGTPTLMIGDKQSISTDAVSEIAFYFQGLELTYKYDVDYQIVLREKGKSTIRPLSTTEVTAMFGGTALGRAEVGNIAFAASGDGTIDPASIGVAQDETRHYITGLETISNLNQYITNTLGAPFAPGQEIQFGVRTVMRASADKGYYQQDIIIDPSPIKWAKATFKIRH